MTHGGNRPGAGRKQGFAATNAEEARRYMSARVATEIGPLTDILIERAKNGDMKAMQILLDRSWGRPRQEVQIFNKETEIGSEQQQAVRETAHALNMLYRYGAQHNLTMSEAAQEIGERSAKKAVQVLP